MCEVALIKFNQRCSEYDILGSFEIVISRMRAFGSGGHEQLTVRIASDYLIQLCDLHSYVQEEPAVNRLSSRNNLLKFKTSGILLIILEESIEFFQMN